MESIRNSTLRDRTFDRLKLSIAGKPADGHGVFNFYTFPFYHYLTKVPLKQYFHEPKVMFDTQFNVLERIEKCGNFQPDTGPVAECSGMGGRVRFDSEGFISVAPIEISSLEDALTIKPGDPYGDNYMRVALETLQYMVENAPADVKVNPPVMHGPFTVCAQLYGISDFCMDTLIEPDTIQALLDTATQTCISYMKACEKVLGSPLHHLLICDDLSALLSPDGFESWVMPTYEKIFNAFPSSQKWLHNDASAQHLCTLIADAGFDAWQYAPSIDSAYAMEKTGGRLSLLGGLSPLELQGMSSQQTYDTCIKKLRSFDGNNKYVLGVGGSVNQIPLDNIMAMLKAADDYKIGSAEEQ